MTPCSLVEIQRFVGPCYFSLQVQYITARLNDVKFQKTESLSFTEEPQISKERNKVTIAQIT